MAHDAPWEHFHDVADPRGGHDDSVVWNTVGIDIGSSTSQVVFSRITMSRRDAHYVVTERTLLHESEVILTPYSTPDRVDGVALGKFIERQFAIAGLRRGDVHTGSVILTGLALATQNARSIADAVADDGGAFVAVSAGDLLEARLAAQGAGAPALSREVDGVLVHIDVGGGTTKLSAWRAGRLLGVAAVDVGARLATFDPDGTPRRMEEPARRAALQIGLDPNSIREGDLAGRLAEEMARDVLRHAGVLRDQAGDFTTLRTPPLLIGPREAPAAVVFTGGVSEYVYEREKRVFGDLGPRLGAALRLLTLSAGVRILPSERGIRATVLGVSQHSAQLSGNTVWVSDDSALPLRNVPILAPPLDLAADVLDRGRIASAIRQTANGSGEIRSWPGLSLTWKGSATFDRLTDVAGAILDGLSPSLGPADPCLVIVDGDVAGVLGARLHDLADGARPIVCLDGVHVHDFDHIDVGVFAPKTRALPVVVKTLLFAGAKTRREHHYDHHH